MHHLALMLKAPDCSKEFASLGWTAAAAAANIESTMQLKFSGSGTPKNINRLHLDIPKAMK